MAEIVKLPYLGTAEEDVLFAEWFAVEGESIKKGQALAVVETLKASFEVESEHDGVLLHQLVPAGTRVPVHAAVGVVGAPGEELDENELRALQASVANDGDAAAPLPDPLPDQPRVEPVVALFAGEAPARAPVAPAARRRAVELGVDLADVQGTGPDGMVRAADVERALSHGPASAASSDGRVDPGFLAFLRAESEAFGALSSEFRVALYRRHGAVLGDGCHIGPGTVLHAERLVLGAGAHFGPDCSVDARELVAGELLHFGPRCKIRCTRVQLGDNAFFTEDVEIGGGGAMDPEAELIVGSHGFVGEHVHLNPCRTLRIGDEVVLSRNAVLMTHSFGQSELHGYPNRFAGITIENGCQVGIAAVLFPGVEMGAGSVLLSGSSLVSAMPPGRLFGGVPATDMKAAARPLSPADLATRARDLVIEFGRQLGLRGVEVETADVDDEIRVTVRSQGRSHRLRYCAEGVFPEAGSVAEEVCVALRFPDGAFDALPPEVAGIDLQAPEFRGPAGPLSDAFREFLRKRGVRLHPRSWAYKGGWL